MVAKIFKKLNKLLDLFIERSMYNLQMWKWEREKREEGFPKEWFEEDKDYRGNPNWSGDD
mgnify:CR=1 FL=1|tara:strand:+ start:761 stop:940 length:180 start_codon:yes stop_codon:yes gene_type:complete